MSVDPDVDESGEPYAYVSDDPVNGTDPEGLWPNINIPGLGDVNLPSPSDAVHDVKSVSGWTGHEVVKHAGTISAVSGGVAVVIAFTPAAGAAPVFELISVGAGGLAGAHDVSNGHYVSAALDFSGAALGGTGFTAERLVPRLDELSNSLRAQISMLSDKVAADSPIDAPFDQAALESLIRRQRAYRVLAEQLANNGQILGIAGADFALTAFDRELLAGAC